MTEDQIQRYKAAYQALFSVLPTPVRLHILSHPKGLLASELAFQALKESQEDDSLEAKVLELMAAQESESLRRSPPRLDK